MHACMPRMGLLVAQVQHLSHKLCAALCFEQWFLVNF